MKAMIFSDLITSKNSFVQLFCITGLVSIFIAWMTETLVAITGCMAAMIPFMFLFSICAYDEQHGWEQFRLTLPMSRKQVALGRYASMGIITLCSLVSAIVLSVVVGLVIQFCLPNMAQDLKLSEWGITPILSAGLGAQAIVLIAAAITLPLILRYGMTKGIRFIPIILVLALSLGVGFLGNQEEALSLMTLFGGGLNMVVTLLALLFVIAVILFVISAFVSAHLYRKREL